MRMARNGSGTARGGRWRAVARTIAYVALASACGAAGGTGRGEASVRDSAGIRIVENRVPEAARRIALGSEPRVRIGVVEGSDPEQLFGVSGAGLLADGRIVVLDGGARDVRTFSPDGAHERTFGGAGDGPGEFGDPTQLIIAPGDTIVVLDGQTWRTTWFAPDGRVLRDQPGRTRHQARVPEGWFAEGALVSPDHGLLLRLYGAEEAVDPPTGGVFRPTSRLLFLPWGEGAPADLPGRVDGIEQTRVEVSGRPDGAVVWFGKRSAHDMGGAAPRIWAGDNEAFELRVHHITGSLVSLVRSDAAPRTVTDAMVSRARERYAAFLRDNGRSDEEVARRLRVQDMAPVPAHVPHYVSVKVARGGGAWVGAFFEEGYDTRRTFHVFGPDGRWISDVETPAAFEPLDIGEGWVIGKRTDELGIEFVELYDLDLGG